VSKNDAMHYQASLYTHQGALPDGLPTLRTSERTTWRQCPQKWWWGYRMGLVPKGPVGFNFWFGIGIHEALADWYQLGFKRGPHPAKSWAKYADAEIPIIVRDYDATTDTTKYVEARDLGVAMMEHYVDTYGKDPHKKYVATEQTRKMVIYDHDGSPLAIYFYTMDGVYIDVEDYNRVKIDEHKTASMIKFGHLALDDQAGSYLTFESLNRLAAGQSPIEEITYNFMRKEVYKVDSRPVNEDGKRLNKDGSVSKQQGVQAPVLARYEVARSAEARRQQHDRIVLEVKEMNRMKANPELVYKNPQQGPFGCESCPFKTMCELHEEGGDWQDLRDWTFKTQDPYGPYRKAA